MTAADLETNTPTCVSCGPVERLYAGMKCRPCYKKDPDICDFCRNITITGPGGPCFKCQKLQSLPQTALTAIIFRLLDRLEGDGASTQSDHDFLSEVRCELQGLGVERAGGAS